MVGPNGAGKTMTIECIEGLRKPDAGEVHVLGLDPQREGRILRERIGIRKKYGLTENLLLENLIYDIIFEQKFNELNESLLKDLTKAEKREVSDHVKNILRNATEDSLLD